MLSKLKNPIFSIPVLFASLTGFIIVQNSFNNPSLSITSSSNDLTSIVAEFFPQRLIDESDRDFQDGGPEPIQFFDFVTADLNQVGIREFIVAAYSNGFSGVVRVLKRQNDQFVLADEPNLPLMNGSHPNIDAIDINNDSRLEVVASFLSVRGNSMVWVFRWDGTKLIHIAPTVSDRHGDVATALTNAAFIDLNLDGTLEVINPPLLGTIAAPGGLQTFLGDFEVYGFNGDKFVFSNPLTFFDVFIRETATPVTEIRTFSVANPNSQFIFKVINGEVDGIKRISSAIIKLNGQVVIGPEKFNQQITEISVPVKLQRENTMSAELRSKPGGVLTVTIEPR